jgi:8-oxo-dGTP pyrophosphatase MutT (NUDIX family)
LILDTDKIRNYTPPFPEIAILSNIKTSSVIMPLFFDESEVSLILTKRNSNLKSHPGQISFPGGVCEKTESLVDAALREWEEEVGVSRNFLEVIGKFDPVNTYTGYMIFPFIAIYKGDLIFQESKDEVERMIFLKLSDLEKIPFYSIESPRNDGRYLYFFDLDGEVLWGATCAMIVAFLQKFTGYIRKSILVKSNITNPPFLDLTKL